MSKFSQWTPTLGVCFKWDSQKVLKIAHFVVFRHIGGSGVTEKLLTSTYCGSRSSPPNMATFELPSAEKLIFSDKTLACLIDCTPKVADASDQDFYQVINLTIARIAPIMEVHYKC